ncbi:MAG: hypothetical protein M1812_006370 [Candelaria pacifica]|nr:MAG: hypothetical protein M1812_006370 [Candelaria pacifica]
MAPAQSAILVREYYQRGTHPRYQNVQPELEIVLPIYWQAGTCVAKLDVLPGFSENSDRATWRDVLNAFTRIKAICLIDPARGVHWSGGYQNFGEANGLVLHVYDSDSAYAELQDTDSDCSATPEVVTTGLACQQRGKQRPRPASDSNGAGDNNNGDQERPAQRPRVCPIGKHYSEDSSCCDTTIEGVKWITSAISTTKGILFGLSPLTESSEIGFCDSS